MGDLVNKQESSGQLSIRVQITRWASDDQPGFVQCEFDDAHGRRWVIIDKVPVVTTEELDSRSQYPRQATISCEVLRRSRDQLGRHTVLITTERPCSIETIEGQTRFEVSPDSLIELHQPRG